MSDNCIPIPINFRQWVLSVEDGPNRKQRQAIEIALNTIASCDNLFKTCSLKGGILMGLRYGSPRFTVDIDLSISKMPRPETPEEIRELLDSQFEYIALDLGYPDILMRVHSIKKLPRKKFDEATFPGLQLKLTFVDKKNERQLKTFQDDRPVDIVDLDVSFNEPVKDISVLKISGERQILAYGLAELLAEKLRSLHQQVDRNRYRQQDAYDIWWLTEQQKIDKDIREQVLTRLYEKSISRGVEISEGSIYNDEIKSRANRDWESQKLELGDLPEFGVCWKSVILLYESLPWEKVRKPN